MLRVTPSVAIPLGELEWRFSGSGGPGGQHANTANTRVELRFDLEQSTAFSARQRSLLIDRLGSAVRIVVSEERSQLRNREIAQRRLAERIGEALREQPRRVGTKPTRGSKERRLQAKREQSATKRQRRGDGLDE